MKREYSFKEAPRMPDTQGRSSYGSNKMGRDSWTDLRVEEIKRKYDTPSHRKNLSHLSNNDRSRDSINDTGTSSKMLKDSVTHHVNRIDTNSYRRTLQQYTSKPRQREEEHLLPTFYGDCKQNSTMEKFGEMKNFPKSEFSKNGPKQFSNYRDYPQNKIDPRVQNIDKINSKIKKILECLHQNDNYIKKQRPEFGHSFLKGSVVSRENTSEKEELQETKILSRQKVAGRQLNMKCSVLEPQGNDLSFSPKNKNKFEYDTKSRQRAPIKSSASYFKENHDSEYNSPYKKLEQNKTSNDSWFENKPEHNRNRARSCLGEFNNEDYKLSSGKKLDDEISRTANRIKALEEEKKKLNIQFKPFHHELRANRSTSNLNSKTYRNVKPPLPRMKTSEFSGQAGYQRNRYQEKSKTQVDENVANQRDYTHASMFYESDFKKIEIPKQTSHTFLIERSSNSDISIEKSARFAGENSKDSSERHCEDEVMEAKQPMDDSLKIHAEEGIENRKRKLLETATVSYARETKRLIESLFQQVKLDEQFRNAKIWFRDSFSSSKWEDLQNVLYQSGCSQDKQSLARLFEVTEEEDNPFFSNREGEMDQEKLVKTWKQAQNHWTRQIAHQFDRKQFSVQKFQCEKVDLERKGHFTVEDLVRFLNMETGTFYRNRDLVLIFKRFTNQTKLQWEDFMRALSN